jgi:hypothetical protein
VIEFISGEVGKPLVDKLLSAVNESNQKAYAQ